MMRLVAACLLLAAAALAPAQAQASPQGLQARKCASYGQAWTEALARFGMEGLSADFLARHAAFLASGCRERRVCPRSEQELALANALTIAAMNDRMASSFVPFICRD